MSDAPDVEFSGLHAFRRDLLYAVCALERADEPPKGLAVKQYLEVEYTEAVNHSRLYQNLDQLVERGLLTKGKKDDRTNEYGTTDSASTMLERQAERRAEDVGLQAAGGDER